jgi:hypothetical protein
MQVSAEQFTNNGTQLPLDGMVKVVVPERIVSASLRQDQQR